MTTTVNLAPYSGPQTLAGPLTAHVTMDDFRAYCGGVEIGYAYPGYRVAGRDFHAADPLGMDADHPDMLAAMEWLTVRHYGGPDAVTVTGSAEFIDDTGARRAEIDLRPVS